MNDTLKAIAATDLDIDLIDRINPFGEAYSILAKAMNEDSLKQVAAVIAGKKVNLTIDTLYLAIAQSSGENAA